MPELPVHSQQQQKEKILNYQTNQSAFQAPKLAIRLAITRILKVSQTPVQTPQHLCVPRPHSFGSERVTFVETQWLSNSSLANC